MSNFIEVAKTLYPEYAAEEAAEGDFYGPGNYQPIINFFGKVVGQVDEQNYSGDSFVLYQRESGYAVLIFGWGSCSGCDALQACHSMSDIAEVIDFLSGQVREFATAADVIAYFDDNSRENEYQYPGAEWSKFVADSKEFLGAVK